MSNRAARVTKADMARALSVAQSHGMTIEVALDGTIKIVPIKVTAPANDTGTKWVT